MELNNEPEAAITLRPRGNMGKTVRGQQLRKRLARLDYALCKTRQIKGKKISVFFFSRIAFAFGFTEYRDLVKSIFIYNSLYIERIIERLNRIVIVDILWYRFFLIKNRGSLFKTRPHTDAYQSGKRFIIFFNFTFGLLKTPNKITTTTIFFFKSINGKRRKNCVLSSV